LDIHNKAGYTNCVDWWSFGCLLFCLVAGECPFGKHDDTRYEVYLRVMKSKYKIPRSFSSPLKKMMKAMFLLKEKKRLCTAVALQEHPWFAENVEWAQVERRTATPPRMPNIQKNGKNNFHKVKLRPTDDAKDQELIDKNYEMFAAFDR
jgi:serine/threonine protein kinase